MKVIAQVYNWEITRTELDFEVEKIKKLYPDADREEIRTYAFTQLIDRYLLMNEAINHGFTVTDAELENAMLDLLDDIDSPETSILTRKNRGEQLERILKSNLIIQKYLDSLNQDCEDWTDDQLLQFYQDRKDFFCREEEVRIYQLMVKGTDKASLKKIQNLRDRISCIDDFLRLLIECANGKDGIYGGDLGFFTRGRLQPEVEEVVFNLDCNEISSPILTKQGYRILTVTEKRGSQIIPFEAIKDCLKASLHEIEEELLVFKILSSAKENCQNTLKIYDQALL
ncbi:MAG TPA: peptidyl-prolyl cis-trans isomerase [Candidatus Cloacimonadota bacterium]|nr:peptidyl-prolyl cis-trans isomerase [Candidatus Cloacimonadota bacterium]